MAAFATTSDVAIRWRPLSPEEKDLAVTLLEDASDIVRTRWPDVDDRIAAGTLLERSVTRVVANMVKRAMRVGDTEGIESQAQTAGPFAVTNRFTNPDANLFLTAEDVRLFEGDPSRARVGWLI